LKDKYNDLGTNSMNKSVRKLHNCKNMTFVSRADTVDCSHFLVVTKDLGRLSTAFKEQRVLLLPSELRCKSASQSHSLYFPRAKFRNLLVAIR